MRNVSARYRKKTAHNNHLLSKPPGLETKKPPAVGGGVNQSHPPLLPLRIGDRAPLPLRCRIQPTQPFFLRGSDKKNITQARVKIKQEGRRKLEPTPAMHCCCRVPSQYCCIRSSRGGKQASRQTGRFFFQKTSKNI